MSYKYHLLHAFSTFNTGGGQVRTCDIINHLGDDYRHTIISMDHQYAAKARISPHIKVDYIDLAFQKKNRNNLNIISSIHKVLKKIRPHLLITSNWGSIEWAMANLFSPVCPQIHAEDGFGPEEIPNQKKRRIWLRRVFLSRVNYTIVPSLVLKKIALDIWKLPPRKVLYIPNGIEQKKFFVSDLNLKQNKIIGIVTRLRKIKNIPRLIEAFETLSCKEAKLWIVGHGEEEKNIQKLVQEKGLQERIYFWGHHHNPSSLFQKMGIFALSSDSEQMPVCVLEAMAAGCAIISTDVGDVKNMVSEENRPFIVPTSDTKLYAKKMQELLEDKDLCHRLGKKNQDKCQREYNMEKMLETYKNLYLKTIKI